MKTLTFPLLCLLLTPVALAAELSPQEIMRKTDRDHRAKDEEGVVKVTLVTKDKKEQERKMQVLFLEGEGEDDKHRLRFLEPASVKGLTLLTHEATGRADDQWVYLPAFKKTKKIASSKRTNRFAQTDFTYEDLRTEDLSAYNYKKLADSKLGKNAVYVIEATPKDPERSGYSKRLIHVDKDRFLIHMVVFFDKKGAKLKTLANRGWQKISGKWRTKESVMVDHQRGSKTKWMFEDRKLNKGLSGSMFTVKSLDR